MKKVKCSSCGKLRPITACGLCRRCYEAERLITCRGCSKLKVNHGHGYCSNCFYKLGINPNRVKCGGCGRLKAHYAKGLCKSCYNKRLSYKWRRAHPDEFKRRMSEYKRRKRKHSRGDSP